MITPNRLNGLSPQHSNTGAPPKRNPHSVQKTAIQVSCHIDYLKLTGGPESHQKATQIFTDLFTGSQREEYGSEFYRQKLTHDLTGSYFHWHSSKEEHDWMLELKGTGCQYLGNAEQIRDALKDLIRLPHKCPRIDIAIDAHGEVSNWIPDFKEAAENGCIHPVLHYDPRKPTRGNAVIGDSFYLGAEGSRKRVFCYDKGLQQRQPAGEWFRWETRFKDESALAVFQAVCAIPTDDQLRALATGVISNVRGKAQEAYYTLCESPLSLPSRRKESTLASKLEHIRKQTRLIQETAQLGGLDPYELARWLDLFPVDQEISRDSRRTGIAQQLLAEYTSGQPI